MMSAGDVKETLRKFGLTPNKALGQNFLADREAAARIADAACLPDLPVLEIGPGLGALTGRLLEGAARVSAVELDGAMVNALGAKFAGEERLSLIQGDFLKFDLEGYAEREGEYTVAGNLPYYVTTPVCMKLLCCAALPKRMALMVQKEAAARFTAKTGTKIYGPLAVLSRLYYACETIMELAPARFYPQPEVDSVALAFIRKTDAPFVPPLAGLLGTAFAMRRKTLANNLRAAGFCREEAEALLLRLKIPQGARAEQIEPEVFAALAREIG